MESLNSLIKFFISPFLKKVFLELYKFSNPMQFWEAEQFLNLLLFVEIVPCLEWCTLSSLRDEGEGVWGKYFHVAILQSLGLNHLLVD